MKTLLLFVIGMSVSIAEAGICNYSLLPGEIMSIAGPELNAEATHFSDQGAVTYGQANGQATMVVNNGGVKTSYSVLPTVGASNILSMGSFKNANGNTVYRAIVEFASGNVLAEFTLPDAPGGDVTASILQHGMDRVVAVSSNGRRVTGNSGNMMARAVINSPGTTDEFSFGPADPSGISNNGKVSFQLTSGTAPGVWFGEGSSSARTFLNSDGPPLDLNNLAAVGVDGENPLYVGLDPVDIASDQGLLGGLFTIDDLSDLVGGNVDQTGNEDALAFVTYDLEGGDIHVALLLGQNGTPLGVNLLDPQTGLAEIYWLTGDGDILGTSAILPSGFMAQVNAVPIPAAAWFFGSAILGLVAIGRRQSVRK